MKPNSIETVSGRFVSLTEPTIDDIDVVDIAWGVSRIARYAGHTVNELTYSVGQHSIFVMQTIKRAYNKEEIGIKNSLLSFVEKLDGERKANVFGLWEKPAAPKQLLLAGLLHDASEAILLDIPTPMKMLPGIKEAYGALEDKFMALIFEKFGLTSLTPGTQDIIRWADGYCLTVEAYHLMRSRGAGWPKLMPVTLKGLQEFELPKPAIDVYEEFTNLLEDLSS